MVESVAIIAVLAFFITAAAVAVYGAGYLILVTPLMRWCLIALVGFLALRVVLLPVEHLKVWTSGYPGTVLEEELRSKVTLTLTTRITPTSSSDRFTLHAQGWLTNNSDRTIERISIWCRAEKLSFGDSETASRVFTVMVRPGETTSVTGPIATDLTGVIKAGVRGFQAPGRAFCRLARVYETEKF